MQIALPVAATERDATRRVGRVALAQCESMTLIKMDPNKMPIYKKAHVPEMVQKLIQKQDFDALKNRKNLKNTPSGGVPMSPKLYKKLYKIKI